MADAAGVAPGALGAVGAPAAGLLGIAFVVVAELVVVFAAGAVAAAVGFDIVLVAALAWFAVVALLGWLLEVVLRWGQMLVLV